MIQGPVVYVDIETTGGSYRSSRVLEVAAIRVENGQEVASLSTLVNPAERIPPMITRLTGIDQNDIIDAPSFEDIADALYELCDGATFIAHNVRFDFSFIKSEFARLGMSFQPKLLCTVRLSRALHPGVRGHSLEKLITRHGLRADRRHRAFDDARAIQQFVDVMYQQHGSEVVDEAILSQLRSQYVPPHVPDHDVDHLPNSAGVYIFRDERHQPLYVGKSIHIRERVISHFRDTSPRELKISQQTHSIEAIAAPNELAALLLESKLVKELRPLFNRQLRRVVQYGLIIRADSDGYATAQVNSGSIESVDQLGLIYGVYESRRKAKSKLEEVTRTFQLCPKLMGIEKASTACFRYQLGSCKGACIGKESIEHYNRRFELALMHTKLQSWPYKTPITVTINTTGERAIVNNWIVEGYITPDGEREFNDIEPHFDLDEYKIISRFLRKYRDSVQPYLTQNAASGLIPHY